MVVYGDKEIYEYTLEIGNTKKLIKIRDKINTIIKDTTHCNRDTLDLEVIAEKIDFIIKANLREV